MTRLYMWNLKRNDTNESVGESRSVVSDFATPWTIQSMEFSRPLILEWVTFPFSRGSSQPRDQTQFSNELTYKSEVDSQI